MQARTSQNLKPCLVSRIARGDAQKGDPHEDGLEAFKRALNSDFTQVIVSPENLNRLLEQSQAPFDPTMYLSRIQNDTKVPSQDMSQRDGGSKPAE